MLLEGGAPGETKAVPSPATLVAYRSHPSLPHAPCRRLRHVFFRPKLGHRLTRVGGKLKREQTLCNVLTSHPIAGSQGTN